MNRLEHSFCLIFTIVLTAFLVPIVGCGPAKWVSVNNVEQHFSILMPSKPEQSTESRKDALGAVQVFEFVTQQGKSTFYSVTVREYSEADAKRVAPERALDSLAGASSKANAGAETTVSKITLGDIPGRQIIVNETDTKTSSESRIYIAGNRVFYVNFVHSGGKVPDADARRFFESFKIE